MNKIRTLSIFSGCGGADIGATRAGAHIVFANDIDSDSMETYRKYRGLISCDKIAIKNCDIADINKFPQCDLVIGCYPCQSFTMGGPRLPERDPRTSLFKQFYRCIMATNPKYFVTENVAGLLWLKGGAYLREQIRYFRKAGKGYNISLDLINAKTYGVPQERRRLFIVGVRKDLQLHYWFPPATHGPPGGNLSPWSSHGDAIEHIAADSEEEYYDRKIEPFSWWYLSRNRKKKWEEPSYAIQANARHVPLHPASPRMVMIASNLKDGFKQSWTFINSYDHMDSHPERAKLEKPRRLSWRECALIQTFPKDFEPVGNLYSKYSQIGNATPPLLTEVIVRGIVDESAFNNSAYCSKLPAGILKPNK